MRSKHFFSSGLVFTWQVNRLSLAGGRLACLETNVKHGVSGKREKVLKRRHLPGLQKFILGTGHTGMLGFLRSQSCRRQDHCPLCQGTHRVSMDNPLNPVSAIQMCIVWGHPQERGKPTSGSIPNEDDFSSTYNYTATAI